MQNVPLASPSSASLRFTMGNEQRKPHRAAFFVVGPPGPPPFSNYMIISRSKNRIVKMTVKITVKCLTVILFSIDEVSNTWFIRLEKYLWNLVIQMQNIIMTYGYNYWSLRYFNYFC